MIALSCKNITYRYGSKPALDDVSMDLEAGRFCALLGPNGAGKSTLFALLTGLLVTNEGRISIAGFDMAIDARAGLAKIGVVFQQQTLDLDMTVARNLNYFAALQGLSGAGARKNIDAALDRLDMRERAHEKVRTLNGGHRRRMEIARALVHQPEVLLLDEPTVGLDTASRLAITSHVHDLAASGLLVLWATHLVDEIGDQDHVVVLHEGKVLVRDTAKIIAGAGTLTDAFIAMTDQVKAA
ncbi:MAG: ATP-binding cassette domain-containing protein [Hyphomicrobiales bacterium]|nr:ATP-binding cassette domain-containing protein [Hyphomicrobiales bacterium]